MLRLFLDRNRPSVFIKLYNTKSLWVIDIITKYCRTVCFICCHLQMFFQAASIENIVTEYHGARITIDKFFTDQKCLCQSVRAWLHLVL